jgi:DHA1 family bicyclomycin/chloramphenicol resistance-like MFS transporter
MSTQKYFSTTAMVAYITFMNMFIPLSIDLYLPALPEMGDYFGAGKALISLTLTVFFVVFAVSIILFGPLSDTYGRRRVLIAGSVIYTIASIGCVCSPNIYICWQAASFRRWGPVRSLRWRQALIKDCFRGPLMTRILAVTQALAVIAPMGAPIIGGFLLTFTDWRGAFVLLTVLGLVNLVLALLMTETLPMEKRYHGSMLRSLTLLWDFSSNRHFMTVLIMFSLLAAPYMAYLSVSSFVYIELLRRKCPGLQRVPGRQLGSGRRRAVPVSTPAVLGKTAYADEFLLRDSDFQRYPRTERGAYGGHRFPAGIPAVYDYGIHHTAVRDGYLAERSQEKYGDGIIHD